MLLMDRRLVEFKKLIKTTLFSFAEKAFIAYMKLITCDFLLWQ